MTTRPRRRAARQRGLSMVELLIALTISAMLLTATMVALDASFYAYASAASSASTHTSTRLVTHRLLTLLRTSTSHGPLDEDTPADADWLAMREHLNDTLTAAHTMSAPDPDVTLTGDIVESSYLRLIDPEGNDVIIEYIDALDELWVTVLPLGGEVTSQPLLGGVTAAVFHTKRRYDSSGLIVLERGSVDITVEADDDSSLELETGPAEPIRIIASTMPRKLD